MGRPSIATCVLVAALVLPRLVHGRPASDDNRGSVLSTLESRAPKPEDFSEPKAISSLIARENLSIPAKSRQRRLSDQRRAELETWLGLTKINDEQSLTTRTSRQLDPVRIGRRRRFAVDRAPTELVSINTRHIGDPAYPLIS
ncbi:PREDICTED: uncharacterized protein LOC105557036 [Vollenhovia emeryi]|uniref:uncharacterized protein LOC105557036 n=1 Tax=Vollenhovia emeryi TaxID=411798 RepID=UPI0005F51FCE|nr:PREDICTED: uncharacterized protein LOC105557036 [Vollenhovia emeryi]XP_011859559.1 PREDICTED: uncharacterized protein LOC105557036 [Vollenhovia emeryi]XP_011859560.1 PREDICTED: uncharacterized protein LOC105557036 [Vollenhovia emeryi]XP_011859561.1 PREDICTED: uncharacterized protein LOC105557036 [Vollenhovia emeryi]